MVSFGLARTLIAHDRSSLLSFGSKESPISILEEEGSSIFKCKSAEKILELFAMLILVQLAYKNK